MLTLVLLLALQGVYVFALSLALWRLGQSFWQWSFGFNGAILMLLAPPVDMALHYAGLSPPSESVLPVTSAGIIATLVGLVGVWLQLLIWAYARLSAARASAAAQPSDAGSAA